MNRKEVLGEVGKCVLQDRNVDYGAPEDSFSDIAARWTIYLKRRKLIEQDITPADVAVMMIDLKLARIAANIAKVDNWIDAAGYAVCGAEVMSSTDKEIK